jgi:predicted dehydrogenase
MAWKIGVLGLTHDHVWTHLRELAGRDDVTLSVADPNAPLLDKARAECGVARAHGDYAALLEREHPDAVLVFADNAGKVPIVELAAAHGRPIMVEKPMAASLAGAERMRVAAANAGVPLMVNWPTAWRPEIRHAIRLATEGAIGDLFRLNFRGGHRGPKEYGCSPYFYGWLYDRARAGAGAYMDYCGYGASIARLTLGMPARAHATIGRLQKEDIAVDDNAVLTLRYPRAMAVIEATWTAAGPVLHSGPVFYGRDGTLVADRRPPRGEGGHAGESGAVLYVTRDDPDGTSLAPPPLPVGERTAVEYFLSCLAADRPIAGLVSAAIGRDTQEILEAGLRAASAGRDVSLPLAEPWAVGRGT